MDTPFVGQVIMFGFSFAPVGHAFCHGQLLPIEQNTALFSLIGTTFGGDGLSTFGLPNLQGRVPVGVGQGPGLGGFVDGQEDGSETVTLTTTNLPSHNHLFNVSSMKGTLQCFNGRGDARDPAGHVPAIEAEGVTASYTNAGTLSSSLASDAVEITGALALMPAGGGQPHTNMQPYLALNYCIALEGVFPSRN